MKVQVQTNNIDMKSMTTFDHNGSLLDTRYTLPALLSISQYARNMTTTSPVPQEKTLDKKYTVDFVTEDDAEEVLNFLKIFFFKDEPLNKYVQLDNFENFAEHCLNCLSHKCSFKAVNERGEIIGVLINIIIKKDDEPLNTYLDLGECKELEEWSMQCIPEGCSFKAVNTNGEIIGVFLNGIITKPESNHEHVNIADECKHKKFKKVLSFMDHIEENFNFFDLYPECDKALDGKLLSVNTKYRGCGIAGALTKRSMEYMKENNIPLYHILCTSHFSARVCEKLGFEEVFQFPYVDYVVNGENPLMPAEPHRAAKILIKQLE